MNFDLALNIWSSTHAGRERTVRSSGTVLLRIHNATRGRSDIATGRICRIRTDNGIKRSLHVWRKKELWNDHGTPMGIQYDPISTETVVFLFVHVAVGFRR
jgi:hypothetical protein